MLYRTIEYFEERILMARPFFRLDVRTRTGRLVETHYIQLDDVVWC